MSLLMRCIPNPPLRPQALSPPLTRTNGVWLVREVWTRPGHSSVEQPVLNLRLKGVVVGIL